MEEVVKKICLDSDILIGVSKHEEKSIAAFASLDAVFYTTSINVFEIWQGKREGEKLSQFLDAFKVFDFDKQSAMIAGDIKKSLEKSGLALDLRDIFIASICIANDTELLTLNKKHFERIEPFGLRLVK